MTDRLIVSMFLPYARCDKLCTSGGIVTMSEVEHTLKA